MTLQYGENLHRSARLVETPSAMTTICHTVLLIILTTFLVAMPNFVFAAAFSKDVVDLASRRTVRLVSIFEIAGVVQATPSRFPPTDII